MGAGRTRRALSAVVTMGVGLGLCLSTPTIGTAAGAELPRAGTTPAANPVQVRDLGTLGGTTSTANDVAGDLVVGSATTAQDEPHAFLYRLSTASMTDLGTFGGVASWAAAVDGATVVGSYQAEAGRYLGDPEQIFPFAYDLDTDTFTRLSEAPGSAVDVSGDLVLGVDGPEGREPGEQWVHELGTGEHTHLATLSQSRVSALDGHTIVGAVRDEGGTGAAGWQAATLEGSDPLTVTQLGTLGEGSSATAEDIADGTVVGASETTPYGEQRAFAYDISSRAMRDLGLPENHQDWPFPYYQVSSATAVSGQLVVGQAGTAGGDITLGFVYDLATSQRRELGDLGQSMSRPLAVDATTAVGTSSAVVDGRVADHAVVWDLTEATAVPEATSTAPSAPRRVTAGPGRRGGHRSAWVHWRSPADTGDSALRGYRVRIIRLDAHNRVRAVRTTRLVPAGRRIVALHLPAGRYRFQVKAVNESGPGHYSPRTRAVRPR